MDDVGEAAGADESDELQAANPIVASAITPTASDFEKLIIFGFLS